MVSPTDYYKKVSVYAWLIILPTIIKCQCASDMHSYNHKDVQVNVWFHILITIKSE